MKELIKPRLRSIFIVLILILSSIAIVSVSGQTDNSSEKNMVLKGTVYHGETDKVISHAWLYIHNDANEFETETNDEGLYKLELPAGWYVIAVGADGYYEQKAETKGEAGGEVVQDFHLKPIEEEGKSSLMGEVFDAETEKMIAGALIKLEHVDGWAEKTESNEEGYYEFTSIPGGDYLLYAEAEGYMGFTEKLWIPPGEPFKFHIKLMPISEDEGLTLCGLVTNILGLPIPKAFIELERIYEKDDHPETDVPGYYEESYTDETGYYEFGGLNPGLYFIHAEAEGYHEYFDELKLPFWYEDELECERERKVSKHNIFLEFLAKEHFKPKLSGQVFDACTDYPIFDACVIITKGEPYPCCWEAMMGPCPHRPSEGDEEPPERPPEPPERPPDRPDDDQEDPPERPLPDEDGDGDRTRCGDDNCEQDRERKKDCDCKPPEEPVRKEFFMWCVFTDDHGYYEYGLLEPGHYNMWVNAHGHIGYYNEFDIFEDPLFINVYLRQEWLHDAPRREPTALLKGHVFDELTQEPIAGAEVTILDTFWMPQPELLKEVPCDPDSETQYELVKEAPPQESDENGESERTRGYDEDRPEFTYMELECSEWNSVQTDREGYFEIRVPSGPHTLVVKAEGYNLAYQRFELDDNAELTVRVPMEPGADGERPLLDADGRLVEGSGTADPKSQGSTSSTSEDAIGPVLSWTLIGLLIVVAALSMVVFRKYRRKSVKIEKNGN